MWRPKEGWKTPKALLIDIDKHPKRTWDVAHSFGWRDGFEAGADAMLGALKREGQHIKDGKEYCDPCNVCITWEDCSATDSGWLVFIPDEENDGNN